MQDEVLIRESGKYKDLLCEYCSLALKCRLTEDEADLMDAILQKAETDPLLNLLIDEADQLIADKLQLIDSDFIEQQQEKLQQLLGVVQTEPLPTSHQACSQELQAILQKQGFDVEVTDGVREPRTQDVVNHAKQLLNEFVCQVLESGRRVAYSRSRCSMSQ